MLWLMSKDAARQVGKRNRAVGETHMNRESSRSHAIFTITVEHARHSEGSSARPCCQRPCEHVTGHPKARQQLRESHLLCTCSKKARYAQHTAALGACAFTSLCCMRTA